MWVRAGEYLGGKGPPGSFLATAAVFTLLAISPAWA